jgi:hypothetical protein
MTIFGGTGSLAQFDLASSVSVAEGEKQFNKEDEIKDA